MKKAVESLPWEVSRAAEAEEGYRPLEVVEIHWEVSEVQEAAGEIQIEE